MRSCGRDAKRVRSVSSGSHCVIGASRSRSPSSTEDITAVAVKTFVIDWTEKTKGQGDRLVPAELADRLVPALRRLLEHVGVEK